MASCSPDFYVRDCLRKEVESATAGRNTIVRDILGNPHWMYVLRKFRLEDFGLGEGVHPAFFIREREVDEILVGKYQASRGSVGMASSVAGKLPWTRIPMIDASNACRAMGRNFFLPSNAVYAANAIRLLKDCGNRHYAGNTNYGRDVLCHWMIGDLNTRTYMPGDRRLNGPENNWEGGLTLTGSGGNDWNDDGTSSGIADLVGNAWEWCSGFRILDGEIQVMEANNSMSSEADLSAESPEWKGMLQDGSLVHPGIEGTLKYAAPSEGNGEKVNVGSACIDTEIKFKIKPRGYMTDTFANLSAADGIAVPLEAKALGLFPMQSEGVKGSYWIRNYGEMMPVRGGGDWSDGFGAGPFAFFAYHGREMRDFKFTFRIAYVP